MFTFVLKMAAVDSFETSVTFCHKTRRYITKHRSFILHF